MICELLIQLDIKGLTTRYITSSIVHFTRFSQYVSNFVNGHGLTTRGAAQPKSTKVAERASPLPCS